MMDYIASALGPLSWLEASLLVVIALMGLMIWVLSHHQECRYDGEPTDTILEALPALAGSTHGQLTEGNAVRLIHDEDFFQAIIQDIGEARYSVNLETYMWEDGEAANMVSTALIEAAGRGVVIRVGVDSRGSAKMAKGTREKLKDAGCRVAKFKPLDLLKLGRWNIRDHRKILVIDGRTAYIGGHCITDAWLKDTPNQPRFHDVSVRVSGPIVSAIQSTFTENWEQTSGELLVDFRTFPKLEPVGTAAAHVAYVRPRGCPAAVQVLYFQAIAYAKTSIRIQNPYFAPNSPLREALLRAVERGVDVQVMVPAMKVNDTPSVAHACRHIFGPILEGGVRIFEYQPSLLHQKIMTIDGAWYAIGSCNFDNRSLKINYEIMAGIADQPTVTALDESFERDLGQCHEVTIEEWNSRTLSQRLTDSLYHLLKEQF